MSRLDEIAQLHKTDKSTLSHGYTVLYDRYFSLGLAPVGSLLELGWGGHEDPDVGGASARTWRDWLPGWTIQIIDNERKVLTEADAGIRLGLGSQADPAFIESIAKTSGPFDIIIDDASHLSSLTIASFILLWPHLAPGGWYVIEDTHMAYHDFYYGRAEADPDPTRGGYQQNGMTDTAMGFVKRLVDEVNHKGRHDYDLFPSDFALGYEIEEVHAHFNIVFVRKRL